MRSSKIFNLIVRNYMLHVQSEGVLFLFNTVLNRKARLQQNTRIKI